jgi:hypothetical protein
MPGQLGPQLPPSRIASASWGFKLRCCSYELPASLITSRNIKPHSMANAMLAALLVLLCATAASAVQVYQRPINGDCIQIDGSSDSAVQLYPDQYLIVGDEETTDNFVTQVRRKRLSACCESAKSPAVSGSAGVRFRMRPCRPGGWRKPAFTLLAASSMHADVKTVAHAILSSLFVEPTLPTRLLLAHCRSPLPWVSP